MGSSVEPAPSVGSLERWSVDSMDSVRLLRVNSFDHGLDFAVHQSSSFGHFEVKSVEQPMHAVAIMKPHTDH